jgi:hypothetical protein
MDKLSWKTDDGWLDSWLKTLSPFAPRRDSLAKLESKNVETAAMARRWNVSSRLTWLFCAIAPALVATADARAQNAADAALKDLVAQQVARLDSPKAELRDAAMARLIKLGPRVLPLLPDSATIKSEDLKKRLEKIRADLRKAEEEINTGATKVTLTGKGIRLSEAIQQLQKQSGNPITDQREQLGTEVTNPALDLDIRDVPFLEALDRVAKEAQVGTTFFTGDGSIGIQGTAMYDKPDMPKDDKVKPLVQYRGPFRIEIKQFGLARDFEAGTTVANLQLEVAWEPRLRPMLLKLKSDELKVIDDRKKEVKPQVAEESEQVAVRPENSAAQVNLNLAAPERAAQKIATLKVKADLTIPAGIKVFKFPSLAQQDVTLKQGDVSVTLQGTEIDEQVWKVNVALSYPGEGPAFESYQQGLFNNRLWLQRADGSRFEHNGGFSNTSSDGGKLGFEYLFVDAPGKPSDYQLIYETPSKVITIPLEFEFKDIPLP